MYGKTMREALEEARAYRDPVNEASYSTQQIRMAYGILNDPRYKQGNYSGAVRAIERIAKGLSNHPDVANALRRANEELQEASKFLRYSNLLIQKGRMQRAGDKQGERLTDIEIEKEKKKLGIRDEFIPEGMVKRVMQTVHDKLSKEGGAAGFDDLAKEVKKEFGISISKDTLRKMPGVKQHRDGDFILEEYLGEALDVKWDSNKQGWFDRQGRRRYLGVMATNKLMAKALDKAKKTGDFINPYKLKHGQRPEQVEEAFTRKDFQELETTNDHTEAAKKLINMFGTAQEKKTMTDIERRHEKTGYISGTDYKMRQIMVNKYYSRLK